MQLLENLQIYNNHISTVEEGVKKLKGRGNDLEAIHIYVELIKSSNFRKKKYYNISKVDKPSKLDEWIFKNLIEEDDYRKYLNKYLELKSKLNYKDIDEYILEKHYRPRAIEILSKKVKGFNLDNWKKQRFKFSYERKSNLQLKDGTNFRFDFRNILESFFILNEGWDRYMLAIGGSGSSYQRERYTVFTTIFYLLGKRKNICHHLLKYNCYNEFEYIKAFKKPIVTFDLGSNYDIDGKLKREIRSNGINMDEVKYFLKKHTDIFN
ncbi:MAG: hypothetical protein Q8N27_03960 [Candidatus Hydromicrobium sp.]|nr:hypothetical protein [Candidatus Hydromicrobium sp.]